MLGELHQLRGVGGGAIVLAQVQAQERPLEQGPRADGIAAARARERGVERRHTLAMVAAGMPEPAERAGEAELQVVAAGRARPRDRGPEVVVLELDLGKRRPGADPARARLHLIRERGEVLRVALPDRLALGVVFKPLRRVLADRLEHREARLAILAGLAPEQAVVHERGEPLERRVDRADLGDGGQRAAAREHRQLSQQRLVGSGEQVVAPVDRRPQRALCAREGRAGRRRAARTAGRRSRSSARGGSTAVAAAASSIASGSRSSPLADRGRGGRVGRIGGHVGARRRRGSRGEQRDGVRALERRHDEDALGGEPQRAAARDRADAGPRRR